MDGNVNETSYVDVAQTWPDATVEELEEIIRYYAEESKKLTDWPDI